MLESLEVAKGADPAKGVDPIVVLGSASEFRGAASLAASLHRLIVFDRNSWSDPVRVGR